MHMLKEHPILFEAFINCKQTKFDINFCQLYVYLTSFVKFVVVTKKFGGECYLLK